jgi:hypothetical protein
VDAFGRDAGDPAADDGRRTLDLPFELRGRRGTVTASIRPNDDPEDLGHPLIATGYRREAFVGFPVLTATVAYDGDGPRAWMGWVQVVHRHDTDGTTTGDVDTLPVFGAGSPMCVFGHRPTFSDAPANPDHPNGDWLADAFLVAIPDVGRSPVLFPVAGFRWGYRLHRGVPVALLGPDALPDSTWVHHRILLATQFPGWTFLDREPDASGRDVAADVGS